jgi:hypothetical protein
MGQSRLAEMHDILLYISTLGIVKGKDKIKILAIIFVAFVANSS